MANARRINRVYRALHRPLTIMGVERKLFFFAMCMGAATFNMLASLLGGILIFLLLYIFARWATNTDPQILRFLLSAAKFKRQYDPAKFCPVTIRRASNA
jgi:type IV secretory pathway TrbD component